MSDKSRITIDELFNQQQEIKESNPKRVGLYTGPAVLKVLAINPTTDELIQLIGPGGAKFDTTYKKKKDRNDVPFLPVTFWLQEVNDLTRPMPFTFSVYNIPQAKSKKGKTCYVNKHGKCYFAADKETAKKFYNDDDFRPAFNEESQFLKFLKCILRFRDNDKLPFTAALRALDMDNESLYNGSKHGIEQIRNRINSSLTVLGGVLCVRRNKEYYTQDVLRKEELFYYIANDSESGTPRPFDDYLLDLVKRSFENNEKAGYPYTYGKITTTPTFERFTIPEQPAKPVSSNPLATDDDEPTEVNDADAEDAEADDDLPF